MNLLLVNYGGADNNSAQHLIGFARGLAAHGHDVVVAVVKSVPEGEFEELDGFRVAAHRTLLKGGARFTDGRPADVLHVWTPRENVRQFVESYMKAWTALRLIIHLEDNEEAIFRRFTGKSTDEALGAGCEWPRGLIHPLHHRHFLASADGITLVHRCLGPLAAHAQRVLEIVPVIDFDFFSPGPRDESLLASLGLGNGTRVIVYNGNDHPAAVADIRVLYDAIERLMESGREVALLRTGHVLPSHYEGLHFRPGPRCVELGFIERGQLPAIMRLADVVVQPGDADAFNSFRLPAKVPEYLSMGKPLVMGMANIGPELQEHRCAVVLPKTSPQALADAASRLLDDPEEAAAMAARGREFAMGRFRAEATIPALEDFYLECLGRKTPADHSPG